MGELFARCSKMDSRIRMLVVFSLVLTGTIAPLRAQEILNGRADDDAAYSIGVTPYRHPAPAHYRALFGMGGNLGLMSDAPRTTVLSASYQASTELFSTSFLSSAGAGGFPRRTFDEFDLLYGYALNEEIAHSNAEPTFFYFPAST